MDYVRVRSEAELGEALCLDGAVIVCGGTDLMVKIHAGSTHPRLLIDVSRLEALRGIAARPDGIEIGSAAPISDLLHTPVLSESHRLLPMVLQSVGSAQIRHRATLGGNLANASPAADSALPLLAYDAVLVLSSGARERTLAVGEFFQGPGRTALASGEYIRSIRLPAPHQEWLPFFHKVGRRQAMTIAIASVAALIAVRDRAVVDVRFAAGSVAPTPRRLAAAEEAVRGRYLTQERIQAARAAVATEISPIDDVRATALYRRDVTADLVSRFLNASLE